MQIKLAVLEVSLGSCSSTVAELGSKLAHGCLILIGRQRLPLQYLPDIRYWSQYS